MKKSVFSIVLAMTMCLLLVGCNAKNTAEKHEVNLVLGEENTKSNEPEEKKMAEYDELLEGKYAVLIEIEDYGNIFLELDADLAPITVTNFMKLVNDEYYTGLTFHRIIDGFMMQGGQSVDNPVPCIKGEFADNGIENPIRHERGVISMARTADPDSASSQFFICQQDSFFLDGQYAAFGHVVSGLDVVDKVCQDAVVIDNNGSVAPENQPVIKGIYDVTAEYQSEVLNPQFIPTNDFEAGVERDTFDSYDEIISLLSKGMAYAYVDMLGADEPVLLLNTSGVFDNGDGNMAALEATPYIKQADGTVRSGSILSSDGTAYPLSVLDGVVYCGSNHTMNGNCLSDDKENPGIMNLFYLYESFDENANVTYGGFIRETNNVMEDGMEVAEDDDKPLIDSYEKFKQATPIYFTVVE